MADLTKIHDLNESIVLDLDGPSIETLGRDYLGYSQLGAECLRMLWYSFRWCQIVSHTGRMQRIFDRGFHEEVVIAKNLEHAGAILFDDQIELVGPTGHLKGHIDGKIKWEKYFDDVVLFENKTADKAGFTKFKKKGLESAFPGYYSQVNSYMKHTGLELAIEIVTCKDSEERHIEIVEYNQDVAVTADLKGIKVVTSDEPFPRIGDSTWWQCKLCDYRLVCHHNEPIPRTCRTCVDGVVADDGIWKCQLHDKLLSSDDQKKACPDYQILDSLIDD